MTPWADSVRRCSMAHVIIVKCNTQDGSWYDSPILWGAEVARRKLLTFPDLSRALTLVFRPMTVWGLVIWSWVFLTFWVAYSRKELHSVCCTNYWPMLQILCLLFCDLSCYIIASCCFFSSYLLFFASYKIYCWHIQTVNSCWRSSKAFTSNIYFMQKLSEWFLGDLHLLDSCVFTCLIVLFLPSSE